MSDIKIVSPSSGTATFTLTTPSGTSTDRTLTLPDQTSGTILTTESTESKSPILDVVFGTDTSGSSSTYFELGTSSTPKVDTHSYWSTSTDRYTPQIPGYYFAIGGTQVQDAYWGGVRPVKNFGGTAEYSSGVQWIRDGDYFNDLPGWAQGIFSMNGTTDYISLVGIVYGLSSKNFDASFLTVTYLRSL